MPDADQLLLPGLETVQVVKPVAPRRVVHCKHDPYDVYVGRGSIWGNVYSHRESSYAVELVPSAQEAVARYEQWLLQQPSLMAELHTLAGKVLGCWCRGPRTPNAPCHGTVLVRLADQVATSASESARF
jgi:hypothetical protein